MPCLTAVSAARLPGSLQADLLYLLFGADANLFVTSQLTRFQITVALHYALASEKLDIKVPTHHLPSLKEAVATK